jgi:cytochrome c oxidase cbb3-type subunit I/II
MKNAKTVALVAGLGSIFAAIFIQALMPFLLEETTITRVGKTVRTDLGTLEEIEGEAVPYPELVARGRKIYIREGCWYCHSMYIRPVAGEDKRWGPISEVGEYAYDIPHTFGTRRIGPDLTRDGGKYGDDWHRAHFFDARLVVPQSIMPKFPWLFEKYQAKKETGQEQGSGETPEQDLENLDHEHVLPVESEFVPNEDGKAVMAFVQFLGTQKGKWRDDFTYQIATTGASFLKGGGTVERGREVYEKRCEGCHGIKGDGKGVAAKFFRRAKPRDFTSGVFKFRHTPSGSLPLDSDLFRTITMGVRGTAMPPWFKLAESERWDVVQYIKTFSREFEESEPEPPIYVPTAPKPDEAMLQHGKEVFDKFRCWECHGKEGLGNGTSAPTLTDDWGDKILPTNFTQGIFKVGPRPEDVFRTFMTGLNGTPMPSYGDFIKEDEAWALSYYVLSFSADAPEK